MGLTTDKKETPAGAIHWPAATADLFALTAMRDLIMSTRRFIDFDGTITDDDGWPRNRLCGVPIEQFFAQVPFIVATMNPKGAKSYFTAYPYLPQPLLILIPPLRYMPERDVFGKDFEALCVTNALIVDDYGPKGLIHAPGCRVVGPLDRLTHR